jgi:hypothetical protein
MGDPDDQRWLLRCAAAGALRQRQVEVALYQPPHVAEPAFLLAALVAHGADPCRIRVVEITQVSGCGDAPQALVVHARRPR